MSRTTPGTLLLSRLGIAFELHPYDYDPEAPRIGLAGGGGAGDRSGQTFKTLMAEVDGKPVCVVLPSDTEASMKKVAACFGGKAAAMMKVPDAERLTGYKVGGIGPFGQKRKVPDRVRRDGGTVRAHLRQRRTARAAAEPRAGDAVRPPSGSRRPHGLRRAYGREARVFASTPSIRLRFCTAAPEAPLPRLS